MSIATASNTADCAAVLASVGPRAVSQMHSASANVEEPALAVRRFWMKQMGLSANETDEACRPGDEPADLDEEVENLRALAKLGMLDLSSDRMSKLAKPSDRGVSTDLGSQEAP